MISVLIPTRNDQEECNATIHSIRETAGDRPEVVVLDDGSAVPLTIEDKNVVFKRIHGRAGVGAARHICATMASRENLLIIDSHMRFEPGWHEKACERLKSSPNTLWSCTCVVLTPEQMEISKAVKFKNGASINFFGRNRNPKKAHEMQFIEPVWLPLEHRIEDGGELPCVLGAAYFLPRKLFFQVGGSRMLKQWGSAEPSLSLKVWLSGGDCRLMRDVRIGHQFREKAHFTSKRAALLFNKIMLATTLFPEPAAKFIVDKMREHVPEKNDLQIALKMAMAEQSHIEVERAFHEAVFTRSLEEYLERFGQKRFWLED